MEPITDIYEWDKQAEALGFDLSKPKDVLGATTAIGPRPFGPRKHASERCESGKRDYCTCDTCF